MKIRWYEWMILLLMLLCAAVYAAAYASSNAAGRQTVTVEHIASAAAEVSAEDLGDEAAEDEESDEVQTVNINTADQETLETLPGIGSTRAKAILAWRERNGSFRSVEDLLEVDGIGEGLLDRIRYYIVLK